MQSEQSVRQEIRSLVQEKLDAGVCVRAEWFTAEILTAKNRIEGEDADFYVSCAAQILPQIVKRVIGQYDPKPVTDRQLLLPGFEHLQKAYTVQRGGEVVLVPVDQLTDDEIEARALEYEAMAMGCRAHAKELRVYRRTRKLAA